MASETVDRPVTAETEPTARAITRGRRAGARQHDSAAYRVRRAPLLVLGVAFAAGILAVLVPAQCARAARMRAAPKAW